VQTAVLTGWGLNKLTGGGLGQLVGVGLGKFLQTIHAANVTVIGKSVIGGGGPVAGGPGGRGIGGAVGLAVGATAVPAAVLGGMNALEDIDSGLKNGTLDINAAMTIAQGPAGLIGNAISSALGLSQGDLKLGGITAEQKEANARSSAFASSAANAWSRQQATMYEQLNTQNRISDRTAEVGRGLSVANRNLMDGNARQRETAQRIAEARDRIGSGFQATNSQLTGANSRLGVIAAKDMSPNVNVAVNQSVQVFSSASQITHQVTQNTSASTSAGSHAGNSGFLEFAG
jgi:hypothetical protein